MLGVGSEPTPSTPEELNSATRDWITIFTKVANEVGLSRR